MIALVALLLCLGAGTVGGGFYAFSSVVVRSLGECRPPLGIEVMQRINVRALDPAFLWLFLGTALLAMVGIGLGLLFPNLAGARMLVLAGLFYTFGAFAVTLLGNVPRNERLAEEPDPLETERYWPVYLREWSRWNHLRTAASLLTAASAAVALALGLR